MKLPSAAQGCDAAQSFWQGRQLLSVRERYGLCRDVESDIWSHILASSHLDASGRCTCGDPQLMAMAEVCTHKPTHNMCNRRLIKTVPAWHIMWVHRCACVHLWRAMRLCCNPVRNRRSGGLGESCERRYPSIVWFGCLLHISVWKGICQSQFVDPWKACLLDLPARCWDGVNPHA